jgi:hypothetical protein
MAAKGARRYRNCAGGANISVLHAQEVVKKDAPSTFWGQYFLTVYQQQGTELYSVDRLNGLAPRWLSRLRVITA